MRVATSLATAVLGLGLAGPARAQSTTFFGGNATPIQNQVVSLDNSAVPVATPQTLNVPSSPQRFFSRSTGRITNKEIIGQSNFPTAQNLPGENYLKAFRMQRYARPIPWWRSWWPF